MKKFIVILIICIAAADISAKVSIKSELNRTKIALNEQVKLTITISGEKRNLPEFKLSSIDGFRVTSSGKSHNISIINGNMTSSYKHSYSLTPLKIGTYKIPPVFINYKGKRYESSGHSIEVVKSNIRAFTAPAGSDPGAKKEIPNLFVESVLDKEKAYVGEQVTYTFKFYRRVRLINNPAFEAPDFKGLISEELPPNRNYRIRVNNAEFVVTEVKIALIPVTSGNNLIPPARLEVTVEDISSRRRDIFSSFFSTGKRQLLSTEPLELKILPLPIKGKPADFSGAVGEFRLNTSLDKKIIVQGEPVTFEVSVSGKGDFSSVKQPELSMMSNFRVYETITSFDLKKSDYMLSGKKSFKTPMVPMISGRIIVDGVSFNYFSPSKEKYIIMESKPIELSVKPAKGKNNIVSQNESLIGNELQVVREDIRYIAHDLGKRKENPIFKSKKFWYFALIPLYLMGILLLNRFVTKYIILPRYPVVKKRNRLLKMIREAKILKKQNNGQMIYKKIEEISHEIDTIPPEADDIIARAKAAIYSPDKKDIESAVPDLDRFIKIIRTTLKTLFAFIIIVYPVLKANAAAVGETEDVFNRSIEFFKAGEYEKTIKLLEKLLADDRNFENVNYNLGNAYWRRGRMGMARVYWDRALKINPGNADAAYNIEQIRKIMKEKDNRTTMIVIMDSIRTYLGLNGIVITILFLGWLMLLGAMIYIVSRKEKYLWISGSFLILFTICTMLFVFNHDYYFARREGIIIRKTAIFSSPDANADAQGTIPEGKKIIILDELGKWVEAGIIEENMKFWIPRSDIKEI
ncbi:BatD family protein [Elusimicrobiota bacterium]